MRMSRIHDCVITGIIIIINCNFCVTVNTLQTYNYCCY